MVVSTVWMRLHMGNQTCNGRDAPFPLTHPLLIISVRRILRRNGQHQNGARGIAENLRCKSACQFLKTGLNGRPAQFAHAEIAHVGERLFQSPPPGIRSVGHAIGIAHGPDFGGNFP